MKLALLIAAVLGAGSASAQQFKAPVTSLGPADAALLVTGEPELFQSATALAAQRPAVQREIAEMELESMSGNGTLKAPSVMRFTALPGGLDYFQHAVPSVVNNAPLYEAGIDVYGMGTAIYWNSRFRYDQGIIAVTPWTVKLSKGRLFGMESFALQATSPDGATDTTDCTAVERIPASQVHPALSGAAIVFTCKGADAVAQHWYLEDYARYITESVRDEDGYLSRFKVAKVKFR